MIKEFTERLFKSAVIYGTSLVLVCSLINCVSCGSNKEAGPSTKDNVCTDTDSISRQLQPDSVRYICSCSDEGCYADSTLVNPCLE